jgi:signal transduction histidine kinase
MIWKQWFRPPRRALTSFLGVVVACVVGLLWLGYRLLEQERALESQRIQEHLEHAADLTAAALERKLADLDILLDGAVGSVGVPDGMIHIVARERNLEIHGAPRLLFYPELEPPREASNEALRPAELIEFQKNDPLLAAAAFKEQSRATDPTARAAALVGLGRCLRKIGRIQEALAVYSELAALGATPVSGLPAELVAREARCSTFEGAGQRDELRGEAAALLRDLEGGRWRLARTAYEFRAEEARQWMGGATTQAEQSEALTLSEAVESLVEQWQGRPEQSSGRRVHWVDSQPVLLAWRSNPDRLTAVAAGPRYLASLWQESLSSGNLRLALSDPEGRVMWGDLRGTPERAAVRTAVVTRLPWTIHVSGADLTAAASGLAPRRQLLIAGLSILTVLLMVSSYLIVRAVSRELSVARLQSDFVASVSHEFRSPLTSMRQLSSLLVQGRLGSEEQRQRSYEFLEAESERLERLVEGLLDFGLRETGEVRYQFERVDAGELVRDLVAGFQRTVSMNGYLVELSLPASPATIRADRDAIGRAIWNLLDNAVKYSPANRTVWVELAPDAGLLAISVRDRGMGIPAAEQKAIFGRFFRGANSREAGIKGAGIGLAMVQHIVTAHAGEIRVESTPGEGSRFTILIPLESEA